MTVMANASPRSLRSALLTLRYRETLLEMNAASLPVTIGRDSGMSIVVSDRQASRFQAYGRVSRRQICADRQQLEWHARHHRWRR
ncbi:hypothetical protein ACU4GD_01155 [Cupriavidus basilensis]